MRRKSKNRQTKLRKRGISLKIRANREGIIKNKVKIAKDEQNKKT